MGLFKRMVVALEKIADKKMINAEEMQQLLNNVLTKSSLIDDQLRKVRNQEIYDWLKHKEAKGMELNDSEKKSIEWGDAQVEFGKLSKYTGG